jgi:hypothetical protein
LAGRFHRLDGNRMGGRCRVPKNAEASGGGHKLLQNLQLLGDHFCEEHREPGHIAARPRQARDVPNANGIGMGEEHDRNRIGGLPRGLNHGRRRPNYDIDIQADQFGGQFGHLPDAVGPAEHE